ncbi:MAG: NADAR family protein [Mucilaginibacter sp.]
MKEIKFYKVSDLYGEFSNFSAFPIIIAAEVWPTVEHYFQATKFGDFNLQDKIRAMASPMDAAKEGRNRNNIIRDDWEEVKEKIMYRAVRAKFLQHPKLKFLLLNTGEVPIVEHTVNDAYWADAGDGSGGNRLGIILMRVRKELRAISEDPDLIFPPWVAFPSIDAPDMFWRMGMGETYLDDLFKYIDTYGIDRYKTEFPQPGEWEHFYDLSL